MYSCNLFPLSLALSSSSVFLALFNDLSRCMMVPTPASPGPLQIPLSLCCMLTWLSLLCTLAEVTAVPLLPVRCMIAAPSPHPGRSKSKLPCFVLRTAALIFVVPGVGWRSCEWDGTVVTYRAVCCCCCSIVVAHGTLLLPLLLVLARSTLGVVLPFKEEAASVPPPPLFLVPLPERERLRLRLSRSSLTMLMLPPRYR